VDERSHPSTLFEEKRMSNSLITRLSLALLICLCVFGALPALAEDTTAQPAATPAAVTPAAAETAPAPAAPATVPTPTWMIVGNCPANTNFCRFAWNASTGCCVATYTAPGAYCGPYCR
jgi:hypothetical protein